MWTQLAANVCILILFCLHSVNVSFFKKSLRMSQVIRSDRKEGRPRGGRHNRNLLIRRMRRDKKLRFRRRPESGVCRDKKKKTKTNKKIRMQRAERREEAQYFDPAVRKCSGLLFLFTDETSDPSKRNRRATSRHPIGARRRRHAPPKPPSPTPGCRRCRRHSESNLPTLRTFHNRQNDKRGKCLEVVRVVVPTAPEIKRKKADG